MSIKQLFRTGLGLALVALVSVQAVAFMNTVEQIDTADQDFDYVQLIDSIAAQLKGEEVECDEMRLKIDEALGRIDDSLDAGVRDEESLLVARDALVSMRLELPCLSAELAGLEAAGPGTVISDVAIGTPVFSGGAVGGGYAGGGGGGCVNCTPTAAASGGGGLRRLLLLGGLTGGIIAAATSGDDDNPPPQTSM